MVIVLALPVALILALLAVLIILGANGFKKLFNATVGKLPLVGGYVSDIMTAALDAASSTLKAWAESAGAAIADGVIGFVNHVWAVESIAADAISNLTGAASRLSARLWNTAAAASAALASAVATIDGAVLWWVGQLRAEAAALEARVDGAVLWWVGQLQAAISASTSYAQGLFGRAEADASAAANAAESAAIGEATNLFSQAEAHIGAVESATMGAITALGGEVVTEIAGAEAHAIAVAGALATTAATGAIDALDQAAHDVVIGPWEALLPEIGAIVGHLPADVAQAIPGLESLPQSIPVSIPGILAALAPAIAATATETARCTVPMCDNLGGLSNLFAGLRDAAFLGLLVALLEEAVHNPGGFASEVEGALYAPVKAAYQGARDLVGV